MERTLHFRPDGTFRIVQFTDIHYTNDDEADHKTVRLMREIIEKEKPDFLITTGDTVYGERNMEYLPLALLPFIESGLPWSFVFGNHDVEFAGSREELFRAVTKLPGCVAFHDEASVDGKGNHMLPVEDETGRAPWVIFGIDSGDYNPNEQVGGYGFVTRKQIEWYQRKIKEHEKKNPNFSSLIFQHIAIPEYEEVYLYEPYMGTKREGMCYPRVNTGFFAAMIESGHTAGMFVGHDHVNDFYGKLYGITLGYGRATGYGTYGAQDFAKGARIFVLNKDHTESFETYVRLEGGIVVDDPWKAYPIRKRDEG